MAGLRGRRFLRLHVIFEFPAFRGSVCDGSAKADGLLRDHMPVSQTRELPAGPSHHYSTVPYRDIAIARDEPVTG